MNKGKRHGVPMEEGEGWDDDGMVRLSSLANAIQVWSALQDRPTTVGEAALTFNLDVDQIEMAIGSHYWMSLCGDDPDRSNLIIEHEGE